ncbi:hypothetical protein PIB30_056345 [Stylosanthes scabra]|uniref:Uncharacterized protein n=1 Tax=Stylosanthes scabra TaxID=79078 RepID=A0ABU6XHM4_9FABA|nr:hypothetical protein [Stylosanthes scabra]
MAKWAAAEVKKKAAARGLLACPHGVPVQSMPPLTQLMNVINSGMTPDSEIGSNADGAKETNDVPSTETPDAKNDQSLPEREEAPVGLGKGLSSLDAKKQKQKPKAGA